ncbi:MAG: hypothetical protein AABX85_04070, partial [Nanoarchaeota archaeon]
MKSNLMKISATFSLMIFIIMSLSFSTALTVLISDQGTDVKSKSTGGLLSIGNLTILIYNDPTAGNIIFNQTITDAITNGSWNLMISPNLEFGNMYWKDYAINGQDLDFDENERLNFQSSLGLINNISFINFSFINSCPEGSSIRVIYGNGSVACETDNSDSAATNLTNYALKNQSETFSENITTTQTGFFGWLGSLANRITKLFVQDIDASGNVNVTGNVTASYFIGNGSLLTNLPAGTESDPRAYNGSLAYNSSLSNYYLASNPSGYVNNTYNATYNTLLNQVCPAGKVVNGTLSNGTIICTTPSAGAESDPIWNANYTIFAGLISNGSYLSTYNATYAANMANNSWNESYANAKYALIQWGYNMSTPVLSYITSQEGAWLSTYNATYAANMANNSWNES